MVTRAVALCLLAFTLVSAIDNYCHTEFKMVSAGLSHSLAVTSDGTLVSWGKNTHGELGLGNTAEHSEPSPVHIAKKDWKQIIAGYSSSYALETDGTLWAFGYNHRNQLGVKTSGEFTATPVQVGNPSEWKMIAAGAHHVVAIKKDGSLWVWGDNTFRQLGPNRREVFSIGPFEVLPGQKFKYVSAGKHLSVVIRNDDTLWGWGENKHQLLEADAMIKVVSTPKQLAPSITWSSIYCGEDFIVGIATYGMMTGWGVGLIGKSDPYFSPQIPKQIHNSRWSSLSVFTTSNAILGIQEDESLYTWGAGENGQLGNGLVTYVTLPAKITSLKWKQVSIGGKHALAIAADGKLYSWGLNDDGAVGVEKMKQNGDLILTPSVCGLGTCEAHTNKCKRNEGKLRLLRRIIGKFY